MAQRILFERSVAIADAEKATIDDNRAAKIVEAAAKKAEAQIAYEHLTHKSVFSDGPTLISGPCCGTLPPAIQICLIVFLSVNVARVSSFASAAEVGVHEARIAHAEKMHQNAIEEHTKTLKSLKGNNWIKSTVSTTGAGLQGKKSTPTDVLRTEAEGRGIDTSGERDLCLRVPTCT